MYVCIHYIGTAFSGIHTAHIQHFCKNILYNYKSVIITALSLTPGGLLAVVTVVALSMGEGEGEGGMSAGWGRGGPRMLFELWSLECWSSRHCNRHPRLKRLIVTSRKVFPAKKNIGKFTEALTTIRSCTALVMYINQIGVLSRPLSRQSKIEWILAASYMLVKTLGK